LEEQGLIKRQASATDRRVKQLCLTDAAEPILTEITRISDDLRQELLADLSAKDIAVARKVMRAIADRLEAC
jgi:MarR family transcriptional regulator, transcriptional regulator for hemolysin